MGHRSHQAFPCPSNLSRQRRAHDQSCPIRVSPRISTKYVRWGKDSPSSSWDQIRKEVGRLWLQPSFKPCGPVNRTLLKGIKKWGRKTLCVWLKPHLIYPQITKLENIKEKTHVTPHIPNLSLKRSKETHPKHIQPVPRVGNGFVQSSTDSTNIH